MYHQQQNRLYPQSCFLANSEAKYTYSILAVANLLAHNNLWLCYYRQVNSVRLK